MSQPPARAGLNRIELRAFLNRIGRDTRVERSKMAASRTLLAAAAIGVASLAFAAGLAASSATAAPPGQPPIVNADAWTETVAGPVQAISVPMAAAAPKPQSTLQCNPWEVSDVAMEEILREMQRRGWRHPRQGEPLDPQASLGAEGIGPVEPDATTPTGGDGRSLITVLTDDEAERLLAKQITIDQLIVEEPEIPPPS